MPRFGRPLPLLPLIALAAGACGRDYELKETESLSSAAPRLRVEPWGLQFGEHPVGDEVVEQLTLHNDGDAALRVSQAIVTGGAAFGVGGPALPIDLAPGASVAVEVRYTALAVDEADLELSSDDPSAPVLSVPLSGEALFPALRFDPPQTDLGRVLRCEQATRVISVENSGEAPLTVTALNPIGDGWGLIDPPALPLTLDPGAAAPVTVSFDPSGEGPSAGSIYAESDDPRGPRQALLSAVGEGFSTDERAERFRQPAGPYDAVDLIFFSDQSSSMDDDRDRIADNFGALVGVLDATGISWQAIVVTADDGCANTGILSGSSAEAGFRAGLEGDWGWDAEAGLTVGAAALEAASGGGCNAGALRSGALPMVVTLADEADGSLLGWEDAVQRMNLAAPGVVVSAVVGAVPEGCSTAAPGYGYWDAAIATGGLALDICDSDWTGHFEELGALLTEGPTDTFPLKSPADPASIEVIVNGEELRSGWTYDPVQQAIVFDEPPPLGAWIEVNYEVSAEC